MSLSGNKHEKNNAPITEAEINLTELIVVVWKGKYVIFLCILLSSILSIAVALSISNVYRSEALLAPVGSDTNGLGGIANQFGGLASLAGVNIASGGSDKTVMGIEVLKSRAFFSKFSERENVLVELMAAEDWDPMTNELILKPEIYDADSNKWVREVDSPRQPKPSLQESYLRFRSILSVSQDPTSGFVKISVEHFSPYVAQKWVEWLILDINETIRQQEIDQAQRAIDYLTEQIENTKIAELQTGFFELIKTQTETKMLANANPEFLFKVLDPAVVPEARSKPNRALMCILGSLLGAMVGTVFVLIRHFRIKKRK